MSEQNINFKYNRNYEKAKQKILKKNGTTISQILNKISPGSSVLEFGASTGYMTRFMQEELNCEVSIIEFDNEAGEFASKYSVNTFIGDIEDYGWEEKFKGHTFDYILFADVLEHLKDPLQVLKRSACFLNPHGNVIISLPNLGYNGVLADLWLDRFNYRELGLLDSTHVRFFSYESAKELITQSGLYLKSINFKKVKLKKSEFKKGWDSLPLLIKLLLKLRPKGLVYQFIIEAEYIKG
ncbi:MAG: class I SAM-dependent methyltransferase [Proteobacteria bacterium]|nr:class I SAM-dependent methyltransferase [Pseudomonadota bacterium]